MHQRPMFSTPLPRRTRTATARWQAYLGLAWLKKGMFEWNQSNTAAHLDQLAAAAEKAFEQVIRDYGD